MADFRTCIVIMRVKALDPLLFCPSAFCSTCQCGCSNKADSNNKAIEQCSYEQAPEQRSSFFSFWLASAFDFLFQQHLQFIARDRLEALQLQYCSTQPTLLYPELVLQYLLQHYLQQLFSNISLFSNLHTSVTHNLSRISICAHRSQFQRQPSQRNNSALAPVLLSRTKFYP
jgi:hypothetical protein